MANTASNEKTANTAVPNEGDHDRVAMLSLNADGTPDQHNPELIGEKEAALAATKEQFKQQAVSAVDQAKRPELLPSGTGQELKKQDPAIAALTKEHEKAETAADAAATKVVDALHQG
jgi:hypothetical protein